MSSDQIDNVASPDSSNNRAMIVSDTSNTNSLDQLFNVLSQPQPNSTPMKARQLPRNFYIPPPKQNLSATLQHNAIHKHSISLPTQLYPNSPGSPASGEDVMAVGRGPLPPGWEMASTPDGRTYFLNHNDKTTQWEDPRKTIPRQQQHFPLNPALPMQAPHSPQHHPHSPISGGLHGHHQQQASLPVQQQQQQQQQQNIGPLPPGWEQAVTPEGETYFLNHNERKTSWFDPRMVHHQHSHSFNPPPNHLPQHVQHVRQSSQPHATSTQQWKQLQMEKEHLRQRHQELLNQERILKKYTKDDSGSGGNSHAQLQGPDPYLSSLATSEHARQGSTDSGLGGATPYHPDPNLGEEMSDMDTSSALRFSPYHNVGVRGPPNHNIELAESSNIEGDPVLDSSMDTHLQPSIGTDFLEIGETPSSLYWV